MHSSDTVAHDYKLLVQIIHLFWLKA